MGLNENTINMNEPKWNWRVGKGRTRAAWMNRKQWNLYGATPENWFFYCGKYTQMDWKKNKEAGRCWQVTIFGLQIGIMYNKYK